MCIICFPSEVTKNPANIGEDKPEKKPCILVFDSLPDGDKADVCDVLRRYLSMEWGNKKDDSNTVFDKENMPQYNPKVRGQSQSCSGETGWPR